MFFNELKIFFMCKIIIKIIKEEYNLFEYFAKRETA